MIRLDNYIDKYIGEMLVKRNADEQKHRKPSGRLSASMLGDPLQWQILKTRGIAGKPFDEYSIRNMLRGKQIEDWLLSQFPGVVSKNAFVEYRGVVGYIDALVDTETWNFPSGIIPVEVKSVKNSKFERIVKEGAQRSHKLQGGLYATARENEKFAVTYVAADDLRVQTYIFDTEEVKPEIDAIITAFDEHKFADKVPVFKYIEKWQANPEYNNYPEWMNLNQQQIDEKVADITKTFGVEPKKKKVLTI